MSTIYTVGDGTRTQMAMRRDGIWFKRTKNLRNQWGKWDRVGPQCPFLFGKYPVRGNAVLPNDPI